MSIITCECLFKEINNKQLHNHKRIFRLKAHIQVFKIKIFTKILHNMKNNKKSLHIICIQTHKYLP